MINEDYEFPERIQGREFTGDIESNGLLEPKKTWKNKELTIAPEVDRIWMSCHLDNETGECWDFIDDEILSKQGRSIVRHNRLHGRNNVTLLPLSLLPGFLDIAGNQYFHNGMKYDYPLLEKLMGYSLDRSKRKDTLVMSQTLNCDRERVSGTNAGPHSVEAWAMRLNKGNKVEHEDWRNFSLDMYRRCYRDVEIQYDILVALRSEIKIDKVECGIDWTAALETEHMAAFWISYSEQWGFPCNIPHMLELVDTLDKCLEETEDKLLPDMPYRLDYSQGCGIGSLVNWEKYSEGMISNTNLTQVPLGWCWPEEGRNRQLPIWKPFKMDGEFNSSCRTYWEGAEAQPAQPAQPAIEKIAAIKGRKAKAAVEAKYRKSDGVQTRPARDAVEAIEAVPGVRAKKAQDAVEAKDAVLDCYHDDAGLCGEHIHTCKLEHVSGPFTRIQWSNYDLGSNNQVLEYLQRYTSWVHTEVTDKGNPKLTEDSFDSIGSDKLGITLKNYIIDKSRRTNIKNFKDPSKGWVNKIRPDGRITPINHTMGTPTARSRHSNLVNVPSGSARWGKEMRQCWTAYEGGKMVGADASGLEMRILAHVMDDPTCTSEIVEGDIHTVIWDLISDFVGSRGATKPVEYALIYGAGDDKLGSLADIEGCKEYFASEDKLLQRGWCRDGKEWRHTKWHPNKESLTFKGAQDTVCGSIIRDRIMVGLKPLGDAITTVQGQAEKGYLVGIDGRKLIVRSTHSALNLLLQSTGAILCKMAVVSAMEKLEKLGLVKLGKDHKPCQFVELFTFYHDEVQMGIPGYDEEKVFTTDISMFDLDDKSEKKKATAAIEAPAERFIRRQRRRNGKRWARPKVNLKTGEATTVYSVTGEICAASFEEMGLKLDLNVKIDAEYDAGDSWYDTH